MALVSSLSFAQKEYDANQIQTIFSKHKSNGAYGAFSFGYSQIDGKDALLTGGRAAFIFDHSFAFGVAGYAFMNNLDYHSYINRSPVPELTLAGGYGGFFIEPILQGRKPVHLSFPIIFGIGAVSLFESDQFYHADYWDPYYDLDNDLFFVLEPGAELEFNVVRFFRTAVSVSYRFTSKTDLQDMSPEVLRGLNFGLAFKFGRF